MDPLIRSHGSCFHATRLWKHVAIMGPLSYGGGDLVVVSKRRQNQPCAAYGECPYGKGSSVELLEVLSHGSSCSHFRSGECNIVVGQS
jgi:hypothetical protein